jgi:chloramphenicol O-acetyltransferase type A
MDKIIEIKNWKRKDYFEFYSKYDEPFWGVVSEIDCTVAYETAKRNNISFFLYYLYRSTKAINMIEEFKYRIRDNEVILFDKVHSASTIGRDDESFGYSFIEYNSDFKIFESTAKIEIERINNSKGLSLNENSGRLDVIHYSTLPWTKFSGLTHARNFKHTDSVPKIVFGKCYNNGNKSMMNVSVNAHHGFADGLHAAKYLKLFQELMNE